MKLKEYIKNLQDIVDKNPDYLELEVVTAKDEEGNGFDKVYFEPTLGNLKDGDFTQLENFSDIDEEDQVINSICVN